MKLIKTAWLTGSLWMLLPGIKAQTTSAPKKLKVFIDCRDGCDMQYIRSEITVVDFLLDNKAADVHVLFTGQSTGAGGARYQYIFFGQQAYRHLRDTLYFTTEANATWFEKRSVQLKYLQLGLVPFLARTQSAKNISVNLKLNDSSLTMNTGTTATIDRWNNWVFRIAANSDFSQDANYKTVVVNGNLSASRITDKTKTGFGISSGLNKSVFEYEEDDSTQRFVVNNHNWSVYHYLVKSISAHWSWAYDVKYNQNTFNNNKGHAQLTLAAEYNFFPYKAANTKWWTFTYGLTLHRNQYYDTTIYNKISEVLPGHKAGIYFRMNQTWGDAFAGISYHHYLHNLQYYNLGIDFFTNIRITGGLSFFVLLYGGITRDQVYLVKGSATAEEVLARRRQLESGYNLFTGAGINYRFGSRLNNVVNPRFNRGSFISND